MFQNKSTKEKKHKKQQINHIRDTIDSPSQYPENQFNIKKPIEGLFGGNNYNLDDNKKQTKDGSESNDIIKVEMSDGRRELKYEKTIKNKTISKVAVEYPQKKKKKVMNHFNIYRNLNPKKKAHLPKNFLIFDNNYTVDGKKIGNESNEDFSKSVTKFQIKTNKKENQTNIEKYVKYLNLKNDEKIESNKIFEYEYDKGIITKKDKYSKREKGNINKEKKSYSNKTISDNKNAYINNKIGIDKEYKEKET